MATQVQLRRGTSTQNDAFTGAQGELTYDTTNKRVRIHDGGTVGGFEISRADASNLTFPDGSVGSPAISFASDTNTGIYRGGTDILKFVTAGTDAITIDASQNVGIGTSSPSSKLTIQGTTDASLYIDNTGDNSAELIFDSNRTSANVFLSYLRTFWNGTEVARVSGMSGTDTTNKDDGYLRFDVRSSGALLSEAMRIDSSGNLLVGTTNSIPGAGNTAVGASIYNDGRIFLSKSANTVASFNRNTSDGGIAEFRKDGATIGSIGTVSSNLVIGTDDTGFYFNGAAERILPINTSTFALRDAAIDLGATNARFKDLYLSGGIGGDATISMSFAPGGNIGVGNTGPGYPLHVGTSSLDKRALFQGSNQYRLGLQNGTSNLVWLGSGGADNFRVSNSSGSTIFEIDSSGVVKNTDFIIPFPAGAAPSGTFTHYNNGNQQSTDASHQNLPVSCNLIVKAIYLYVNSALSSGSATVNLRKNGATAATINVTTGTNAFNSTGLNISFNAGHRMGIQIVGTSTSAAWYNVSVLCERA